MKRKAKKQKIPGGSLWDKREGLWRKRDSAFANAGAQERHGPRRH